MSLHHGYDMTSNTTLLMRTTSKIESLEETIKNTREEITKLKKLNKEAKSKIKFREHKTILFGKRIWFV